MIYNSTRSWVVPVTNITLANNNGHWMYIKVPVEEGLTTSEVFVSESHVDPLRDAGFIIYKLGYIQPVTDSRREVSMVFGNVKTLPVVDKSCEFSFDFKEVIAFTFVCPHALKFTTMTRQQVNAPTLSVALNTNMTQFQNLIITPDAVGLVILTGIYL